MRWNAVMSKLVGVLLLAPALAALPAQAQDATFTDGSSTR